MAKKTSWHALEKRALNLLKKTLQSKSAGGGTKCILGKCQIDAYAIFGNTALIVECKTSASSKNFDVRSAIDKFTANKAEIRKDLRKLHGNNIAQLRFALIVSTSAEIAKFRRRRKVPKDVAVWTPAYFNSLEQLGKAIGPYAVPYLLRELGVVLIREALGIKSKSNLRYPALQLKTRKKKVGTELFGFFCPAKVLLDLGYVARRDSTRLHGYQRLLKASRLKSIGNFIGQEGIFKNSVVVSLPRSAKFSGFPGTVSAGRYASRCGMLKLVPEPASIFIVDGQHRIYGYANLAAEMKENPISVIALLEPTPLEQGKTFVDINKNQKPVDPNILWDLYLELYPQDVLGIISGAVRELTTAKSSPLRNRIYAPSSSSKGREGYAIYLANVCVAVERYGIIQATLRIKGARSLEQLSKQTLKRGTKIFVRQFQRFYRALQLISEDNDSDWYKSFFLQNNGIAVALKLFREVAIDSGIGRSVSAMKAVLNAPLAEYFEIRKDKIKDLALTASSEGTREVVAIEIIKQVNLSRSSFGREKLKEAGAIEHEGEIFSLIGTCERDLRKLIQTALSGLTSQWWAERIPIDVKDRIEKMIQNDPSKKPSLDLAVASDYMRIISHNWKDCFEEKYKAFGKDKQWVDMQFRALTRIRNKYLHFYGVEPEMDLWEARITVRNITQPLMQPLGKSAAAGSV